MPIALYSPYLLTATDLNERQFRLAERGYFPDLIRRLVLLSDSSARGVQFRADEGIAISGWDGTIDQATGTNFIPTGASRWELGTNLDAASKIKSDFAKRNAPPAPPKPRGRPARQQSPAPAQGAANTVASAIAAQSPAIVPPTVAIVDPVDRTQTTLVFAVVREWPDGKQWAKDRTKDSDWKEIRVLDATDIHTWLTQQPGAHLWFSARLGKSVEGIIDLEQWWLDWSYMTMPKLRPEWLLTGREEARAQVLDWLGGTEETLPIFASSPDEARAFVAACVLSLPDTERLPALTSTFIVTDERAWMDLSYGLGKLVLLFGFESPHLNRLCASANRRGKRVILTCSQNSGSAPGVVLPPINQQQLRTELELLGMPAELAAQKAALAGQSFTSFQYSVLKFPFLG